MTLKASSGSPINGIKRLRLFFVQEYLRIMRGSLAKLITAVMLYTLIAIPFIMERPPKELVDFLAACLGGAGIQSKLILFVWTDAAMNKLAVILGTVLAGGIIVDEKAGGLLTFYFLNLLRPVIISSSSWPPQAQFSVLFTSPERWER